MQMIVHRWQMLHTFSLLCLLLGCNQSHESTTSTIAIVKKHQAAINKSEMTDSEHSARSPLPTQSEISQLPPDGGDEFNRLIFESSPYLLQHARNPIDWMPWGELAFEKAKELDRPIFLSIGYTTCHWCHVMEHESFEDQEIADIMNNDYICVKVDREERPDVDNVYMSVTQMMTGRGGWPMTVIMSPEKVPFFAGTYFPKSSMFQLLPHFTRVWKEDRKKVKEVGQAIITSLEDSQSGQDGGDLNASHLQACYDKMIANFDPVHGGFGESPKFPTCHSLSFLLRYYQRTGQNQALDMVEKTLKSLRSGGIYDQIGYGIHRYSTDRQWLLPHFEKMLYDQALFTVANLECYLITKNQIYLDACTQTLEYVSRELTSPEGGFYSAEDADSEGVEGKFYLWSLDELHDVLGKQEAAFFAQRFQFLKEGNYQDESTHEKTGKNIPYLSELGLKDSLNEKKLDELEVIRKKLFKVREERVHPQLDDKILTDWNGLMISAFARCARSLNNRNYLQKAKKAADFCLSNLREKNGRLLKRWRLGKAGLPAHLEDYAFLIQGLMDLYEASFETKYLRDAIDLCDLAIELFEDEDRGGFYLTANDGEKLLIRPKEIYDGAIPSGNSVMAINLARIWKMTGNSTYHEKLISVFSAFGGFLESNPQGAEVLLNALDFALGSPMEFIIAGDMADPQTRNLMAIINQRFIPSKVLLFKNTTKKDDVLHKLSPFIEPHKLINGSTAVYVCRNQTCDAPKTETEELKKYLDEIINP